MKRVTIVAIMLSVFAGAAIAAASKAPVSTTQADSPSVRVLWDRAMIQAETGRFQQARASFAEACKLAPDNSSVAKAAELMSDYLQVRAKMDAGRQQAYQDAIFRIERCLRVEKHIDSLKPAEREYWREGKGKDKGAEKYIVGRLRKQHKAIIDAYNSAVTIDDLAEARPDKIETMRAKTIKAMDDALKLAQADLNILNGKNGSYADEVRQLLKGFVAKTKEYRKAWQEAKFHTPDQREASIRHLWGLQYDMALALGDFESMTATKPWRLALGQSVLAKRMAMDGIDIKKTKWLKDVETLARHRITTAEKEQQWYDVLVAASTLDSLIEDDSKLRDKVKDIAGRTRYDDFYGKDADKKEGDYKPTDWREIVLGADADLVNKVIEQLYYYVQRVDYREVSRAGLNSIRMLINTRGVEKQFPKLGDRVLRGRFAKVIDKEFRTLDTRDRVAPLDLQLAFNNIVRASEDTVEIPTAVIAVEFTRGMLSTLDDFSSMIWPHDVREFDKHISGEFVGAGIHISKEPKEYLKVVSPLYGTPAYRAGIKRGDMIQAVDGTDTRPLKVDKLVSMITGRRGTRVVLRIKREGVIKPFDVTIVRESIIIKTVKGWQRQDNGGWKYTVDKEGSVGYIRVTQFTDSTKDDFVNALKELRKQGAKSLVLDLRENPGGLLRVAIIMADEFLSRGKIVSTRGFRERPNSWSARVANGAFETGRLVVLVNRHSASASEIVSGALQDLNRGIIVGERSFGKGSVQQVKKLRTDRAEGRMIAALKLTTAYYYLPSGRLLHHKPGAKTWGVDPDVEVKLSPRQLRQWQRSRWTTELREGLTAEQEVKELKRQLRSDLQLNTAVLLLKLKELKAPVASAVAKMAA